MKKFVTLKNVVDTRTELFHSIVICDERKVRYFVPVEEEEQ